MNLRIKELLARAHLDVMEDLGNIDTNQVAEKFAELIIKECADYVQFYYKDHMCEVIAHDMKTHFGVK